MYFARLLPEQSALNTDPDENIEVVHLTAAQIDELIARGEIVDGKTLAIWSLYAKMVAAPAAGPTPARATYIKV